MEMFYTLSLDRIDQTSKQLINNRDIEWLNIYVKSMEIYLIVRKCETFLKIEFLLIESN